MLILTQKQSLAAILVFGVVSASGVAQADVDWMTKGGSVLRQSVSKQNLGLFEATEWWRLDQRDPATGRVVGPGQSAAQPIVVGDFIYHLAGQSLWKGERVSEKDQPKWTKAGEGPVNIDDRPGSPTKDQVKVPASTPTYSPQSGMLYFGTGYGTLWAYDTRNNHLTPFKLSGCPVVTSPLVLRVDDRDLVIVGDKDTDCYPGPGGNIWLVWGLDVPGGQAQKQPLQIGGWVTSSPVEGNKSGRFVIGADGVDCRSADGETWLGAGMAGMFEVRKTGDPVSPYRIKPVPWGPTACIHSGQAGSLSATDSAVYWVDVNGQLYARSLDRGAPPEDWPDSVDVPALIGGPGSKGFTNTEPAIVTGAEESSNTIVVTLRNFVGPNPRNRDGSRLWLRGCGSDYPTGEPCHDTGAPGAVAAIDLNSGALKWQVQMPLGPDEHSHPSINTAPLILAAQNAVIFGDVNGQVHSFKLNTRDPVGRPQALALNKDCNVLATINLLNDGENPARGEETWSQVSGVGTDPMLVPARNKDENPLILMGVNYAPPGSRPDQQDPDAWRYGRLVAYRSLEPYNLRWTALEQSGITLRIGKSSLVGGTIILEQADLTLGELQKSPVPVRWALAKNRNALKPDDFLRDLGPLEHLPLDMRPGQSFSTTADITLNKDDPATGYIVGVIDPDNILRREGAWGLFELWIRDAFGLTDPPCPGMVGTEMARTDTGNYSQTLAFLDNYLWIPYTLKAETNLKLTVTAPAQVAFAPATSYKVTFQVTNEGELEATVPLTAAVRTGSGRTWSLGAGKVTVAPGQTVTQTRNVSILACRDSVVVEGEINPEPRTQAEPTYDDNKAAALTRTGPCDAAPAMGGDSGNRSVIIVPDDCITNPDWSSKYPCLNYPNLKIPD